MLIKNISKNYGETTKILSYFKAISISPPACTLHGRTSCPLCFRRSPNPTPSDSSIQRTKTLVSDIVLANNFDLFCTFTLNKAKIDRYDIKNAKIKIRKWLNHCLDSTRSNYSPDLKYLVIPELHHDGAIHFHLLLKNYKGKLNLTKHKTSYGSNIYNITNWTYGHSTCSKINNKNKTNILKVSTYIKKYITKDMILIGNKNRYFCSKNLNRPIKTYNVDINTTILNNPLFLLNTSNIYRDKLNFLTGEIESHKCISIYDLLNITTGI